MKKITVIGIDIAQNVFQLHAVGSEGTVVLVANCGVARFSASSRNSILA